MATFINMGFLNESGMDAVVQVADHIATIIKEKKGDAENSSFDTSFKSLYEEENYFEIFKLLISHGSLLFEVIHDAPDRAAKEREAEGYYTVLISMLLQMEDEESLKTTTDMLCATFGKDTESPELRLKLFMSLYNIFQPSFPLRYPVYLATLEFSAKVKMFDAMVPYLDRLEDWLKDWDVTTAQKRDLFLSISQKMRALDRRAPAFEWLQKHCFLYSGDTEALKSKEATQAGLDLALDAITLPNVLEMDELVALEVVQGLSQKAEHKPLVELLDIFMEKEMGDLEKFHKANKKLFDQHKLSFEDATTKMRLLTMASLAQGKAEIPLTEVARVLNLGKEEAVEKWVVRAISEGVIDGRIDQVHGNVLVKSSLQRRLGKKEWQFLATKLDSWISNMDSLLAMVKQQQDSNIPGAADGGA